MPAIDMDDLIASFASTAHISQEAMDIAALQKQLSQTLQPYNMSPYCQQSIMSPSTQAPLTSPSSSWMGDDIRRRNRSTSRSRRFPSQERSIRTDAWRQPQAYDVTEEEEQDMQMVEDELEYGYQNRPAPHPDTSLSSSSWYTSSSAAKLPLRTVAATAAATGPALYPTAPNGASYDPTTPTHSSFAAYAAIDPFFAAQLQAASSVYASSPSGFQTTTHAFAAAPN